MKRPYLTVSVSHLQETVTEADVQTFFKRYDPVCAPVVGPMVSKDDRYWATTVTFKGKSKAACYDAVAKLNGQLYLDTSLNESQIGVSHTFHGLTPLYESSKSPATFEYVFWTRDLSQTETCLVCTSFMALVDMASIHGPQNQRLTTKCVCGQGMCYQSILKRPTFMGDTTPLGIRHQSGTNQRLNSLLRRPRGFFFMRSRTQEIETQLDVPL
jgi:hypothetical protein